MYPIGYGDKVERSLALDEQGSNEIDTFMPYQAKHCPV